jgi:cyclopropane-fatty-acyl-phospholipid synthase
MSKTYPNARIVTVSNSKDQKQYIDNKCKKENITNIKVITCDMNDFSIEQTFDRVVSIEMFEHMRNYQKLLKKIA